MTGPPTIHFAVARALDRFLAVIGEVGYGSPDIDSIAQRDSLSSRRSTLYMINADWCLFGFGCVVAMGVIGVPDRELVGEAEGNAVFAIMLGACFFCIAGCAHVLRRWYWYLPKARRRLRAGDRPGYENYMARALPRNSSVVFQTAVGVLTVLATGDL